MIYGKGASRDGRVIGQNLADGNLEPPFVRTLDVPPSVWADLEYLLTIVGSSRVTEYWCEVDPGSIQFEGNKVRYELECVLTGE
ncbi:MAG: hypothetical protein Fur0011_2790 [Candidatus Microgenomates bacterium]